MDDILIFTDGACSGNPGPGGWAAIVALPEGKVRELGGGADRTTNNRMEVGAAVAALDFVKDRPEAVVVFTDSTYMISGITQWIAGWKRKGWVSSTGQPVLNRDLWERLDALASARRGRLSWRYVRGHSGHDANERCDVIAVGFSKRRPVELYDGPMLGYPVSLLPPAAGPAPERKAPRKRASSAAGIYLSLVGGELRKHATWDDCSARVKGVSGARFKKVTSAQEETQTLRGWGLA